MLRAFCGTKEPCAAGKSNKWISPHTLWVCGVCGFCGVYGVEYWVQLDFVGSAVAFARAD
jgi:hypothetical protein